MPKRFTQKQNPQQSRHNTEGTEQMTLKKWDIVTIDGETCQLTETPERVADDTWELTYRTRSGNPSVTGHATDAEMAELAGTINK